jgi:hypothetical protein
MIANPPSIPSDRPRLSVDLSPSVSSLLDHINAVTGTPKTQIVAQALLDALPGLLERADTLQKRSAALGQAAAQKKR